MTQPPDIIVAHEHSIRHRPELEASEACGCFYCLAIFPPSAIEIWVDYPDDTPEGREDEFGVTALCPKCGIDSVIGSASGYPINSDFLDRMEAHWFGLRAPRVRA